MIARTTRVAFCLFAPLALASCLGGGSGNGADGSPAIPPVAGPAPGGPVLPPDDEILAKIYDPDYTVPAGFFVDERASTPGSYTLYHVKDVSVSYEVCTDDFATAQAWEEADNASRSVNGYYVGHLESERYFEFVRELDYDDAIGNVDEPTSPGFARVFKCSYASRDGVDRSLLTGYAGRLNARPLTEDTFRQYVEYFWQFAFFNVRAKKVLASTGGVAGGTRHRTLLLGFASLQGADACELIEVVEWRFELDADTGNVQSRFDTVRSFRAEVLDGAPRICDAD